MQKRTCSQPAAVVIHSSGLQSVVNAKERAGRDFIATRLCTRHEKREYLRYNIWDDLESKGRSKYTLFNSIKNNIIQFNT